MVCNMKVLKTWLKLPSTKCVVRFLASAICTATCGVSWAEILASIDLEISVAMTLVAGKREMRANVMAPVPAPLSRTREFDVIGDSR